MALYTPAVPESTKYSNLDLNSLASTYAATFSHQTTSLIQRVVRQIIYDSAPQQYLDLLILNKQNAMQVTSDEFFYQEMGWGRTPLSSNTIGGGGIASGATQVIPVTNPTDVSVNTTIIYSDNSRGTVTNISGGNITVTAQTGETLPALAAAAAGTYTFSIGFPVEADGQEGIYQYFRQETTERYNYVQLLSKAMRMGAIELLKYQKAGTTSNYLQLLRQKMVEQFRVDVSNVYWNGKVGESTVVSGASTVKAKMAGGIYPTMVAAGSPNSSSTMANTPAAIEKLALDTEYKTYGMTRFLYGTPRAIHYLSKEYKSELTRYEPDDMTAKLGLKGVDMGSTKIVFVPMKRFEDTGCFPPSFRSKLFLIDQASIKPVYLIPERMGQTLSRGQGILKTFVDTFIEGSFSIQFDNPLGCGYHTITDLP